MKKVGKQVAAPEECRVDEQDRERCLETRRRIENWRRVVSCGFIYHRCGSAEKYYRSGERATPSIKVLLDVNDGWVVEDAWRRLAAPVDRWLLHLHYICRVPPERLNGMLRLHAGIRLRRRNVENALINAVRQLSAQLERLRR